MAQMKIDQLQRNCIGFAQMEARELLKRIEEYKPYLDDPIVLAEDLKFLSDRIAMNISALKALEEGKRRIAERQGL